MVASSYNIVAFIVSLLLYIAATTKWPPYSMRFHQKELANLSKRLHLKKDPAAAQLMKAPSFRILQL
jgi:hypothetical protein